MKEKQNNPDQTPADDMRELDAFREEFADISEMMQVIGASEPRMDSGSEKMPMAMINSDESQEIPSAAWWTRSSQWIALAATLVVGISSGILFVNSPMDDQKQGIIEFVQIQGLDVRSGLDASLNAFLDQLPDSIEIVSADMSNWQRLQQENLPDGVRARITLDPFAMEFVLLVQKETNDGLVIWRSNYDPNEEIWPQLNLRLRQLGLLK